MRIARVVAAASVSVAFLAALTACGGSFGSGSTGPVPLASLGGNAANPSPTPTAASVVVTYGDNTSFQTLPQIGDFAASIAFPKQPPPTPDPKAKTPGPKDSPTPAGVPTAEAVAIGATFSTGKLEEGPDVNFVSGKGKKKKSRGLPARAIAYIKLLPTHDATLASYPRIEFDIPRELAAQYRDGEFGLALWNSGEKDNAYRLNVAERDYSSPLPMASRAPVTPPPSSTPSPVPSGSSSPGASPSPQRPANAPAAAATPGLPPQRVIFVATEKTLKLVANRPLIFALYALPQSALTPSPVPSGSAAASATAAPKSGKASAAPAASGSPATAGSAAPAAAASAAPASALTAAPQETPESH